ncbi:MAG: hypothetical protein AB7N76_26635 [Planctomycetota bacterium]
MSEVPGWMREQLEVEGWVAAESLETFDVHLGRRYPNRAEALQQALTGDALLSSRGRASLSREVEGEVVIGRLRRSAQPIRAGEAELMFVYALDAIERHPMPPRKGRPQPAPPAGRQGSRPWACPGCKETFLLPPEEPDLSEERARCPECGEAPSQFTAGQVVRVRGTPAGRARLGVIDGPVRTDCVDPDTGDLLAEEGPYTGEYMVWHLRETTPVSPAAEREVFANLPREPERRRTLASNLMAGTSAWPEEIEPLGPQEAAELLGA